MARTLFGRPVTSALAFALVFASLWGPRTSHAHCRTITTLAPPDYDPSVTGKCFSETVPNPIPLFWRNACVGYSLNERGSTKVAFERARSLIAAAFGKWTGITCPTENGARSRVSIDVRDLGTVSCGEVDFNGRGPNQNVIVFRDEKWTHDGDTLGLTTTSFNASTGELFNVDMEINTTVELAYEDPVPATAFDFEAIVTHEVGHFLGMAHSEDPYATMAARIPVAFTRPRRLSEDDVEGLCQVYRPDGTRRVLEASYYYAPQCDPTPRRGFTRDCKDDDSCAVAAPGHASETSASPILVGLAAIGVALRRRSRASAARRGGRPAPPSSSCASPRARAR